MGQPKSYTEERKEREVAVMLAHASVLKTVKDVKSKAHALSNLTNSEKRALLRDIRSTLKLVGSVALLKGTPHKVKEEKWSQMFEEITQSAIWLSQQYHAIKLKTIKGWLDFWWNSPLPNADQRL